MGTTSFYHLSSSTPFVWIGKCAKRLDIKENFRCRWRGNAKKKARTHPRPTLHEAVIVYNIAHSVGNFHIVHLPRVPPQIAEHIRKYHVLDDPGCFIVHVLIFLEGLLPLIVGGNIVFGPQLLLPLVSLFLGNIPAATDATPPLDAPAPR